MSWRRRVLALVLAAAAPIAVAGPVGAAAAGDDGASNPRPDGRVLVVAVPALTWSDVRDNDLPALRGLLAESGVGSMAVRVTRHKTRPGDGYATLGAGTRTVAPASIAGLALAPDEPFEAGVAADAFERRTGRALEGAAAHLRIGSVLEANDDSLLGGTPAELGDALADAGIPRGVVANADPTATPESDADFRREAVLALMDRGGTVPCGRVDRGLVEMDEDAPFGVRSDLDATVAAFEDCWSAGGVVLVETSDLRRAHEYGGRAERRVLQRMIDVAQLRADELVRRLLERVDPSRDAVVVVAPSSPIRGPARLTVVGVRAPGVDPGLLTSGSTRQAGYVSIVDLAPTIAELAGAPFPEAGVDGRPVTVARRGGDFEDRVAFLADADLDARFRARIHTPTVSVLITLLLLLVLAVVVALWWGRRPGASAEVAALALLGALPLTYLAAPLPFAEWGWRWYLAFVLGGGCALALLLRALGRRHWAHPLVGVLGLVLLVPVVSVTMLDSRLQVSTVFGDSPIGAGRFSGVNNKTFAVMVAATILLSAIIANTDRRDGRWRMVALSAAVLLVLGAPMWGADVGGVLAGLPALAFAVARIGRWRIRLRTVLTWCLVTVVLVGALGLLDLARDSADQSHLGRLFERIGADGWDGFVTVVMRKLDASVTTLSSSVWRLTAIPVVVLALLLAWRVPRPVRVLDDAFPELRAALVALGLAGVLGFALNDSGVEVPGTMAFVGLASLAYLVARADDVRGADDPPPAVAEARVEVS